MGGESSCCSEDADGLISWSSRDEGTVVDEDDELALALREDLDPAPALP